MKTKIFTLFFALVFPIAINAQSYNCVATFNNYHTTGYQYHFYANSSSGYQNTYSWNFGDGTDLGSGIYPWHTYSDPGTYNVCLTVYNINTTNHETICSDTTCHTLIIADTNHCVASFDYTLINAYQYHLHANNTSGNQNSYSWNFGDGSAISSNIDPTHTFPGPGTYNVCLTVYKIILNDTLCSETTCQTIIIENTSHCVSSFNYTLNTGFQYHFNVNATSGNQNTYSWNFGDGSDLGSSSEPTHTFPGPGIYNVCMTAYYILMNDTLCSNTTCQTITIANPYHCVASFNNYHSGYQYHFYASTTSGNQNTYSWNFGDGTTGSGIYPLHTYLLPGTYNVCLTVYDINPTTHDTLCSKTTCQTIIIENTSHCVSSFNYTLNTGYQYHFNVNATSGNQNTYSWNFGDGSDLGSSSEPTHTFPGPGTYNVCLTAYYILMNDTLCSNTTCQTITIANPYHCVASFNNYHSGYQYHFYASTTSGNQNTYSWSFGDGTTGSGIYPLHTYLLPGTYNVCLTVYDIIEHDTLCSETTCQTIIIENTSHCVASFNYTLNSGYQYHFNASTTSGNQNTYSWNFGDGSDLVSNIEPTHTFPGPGTYNVCLKVYYILEHDTLCSETQCKTIIVPNTSQCVANFTNYHSGYQYHFNASATTGNQNTYSWNFGDGSALASTIDPWHTFPGPGTYNVCLKVFEILEHDTLCSATSCQTITVADTSHCVASFNNYHTTGYQYHFYSNAQTGSQNTYSWNFGDGSDLGSGMYPWHTFSGPGTHNVCLTVFYILLHDTLCSATTCHSITVADTNHCIANFNFTHNTNYQYQYHFNANAMSGNQNTYSWNFGDGSALGSTIDPVHNFPGPGTYNVCLTVYDILVHDTLCSEKICQTIIIPDTSHCVASFSSYLYTGYKYHFYSNAQSGNQNTYSWNFGDGSALGSGIYPWHTFSDPGTYNVCLTVYDIVEHDTLCSATTCHTIIVADTNHCVASFNYTPGTGYQYHFHANASSGNQNTYSWNFGDGSDLGSNIDPWHNFVVPGSYNVCLTVYDIVELDTLCSDKICQTITIVDTNECVASFNNYHYTGYQYHFYSNAQSGNQNTYSWNFGDDSALGSGMYPWHTFSVPGTYNVCLTVYDILEHDTLCSANTCHSITVADTNHCMASFNFTHSTGYQYHFHANATSGNQNTYSWNFGDDSALGSNIDPWHTFIEPGTYNVCLTVYDILNNDTLCSEVTCQTIIVVDTSHCVASFNNYHYTGYQYHFYSNAQSGNQNTYSWNFGDGSPLGNGIYPWHTFSGAGIYNVCLTVYDIIEHDTICSATSCHSIIVADTNICVADFNNYHSGYFYHFYANTSSGNQNNYSWNFGDGSDLGSNIDPLHTFPAPGSYNVCLMVYDILSNDTLCSDTLCKTIIVADTTHCIASFNNYHSGYQYHFYATTSSGNQNTYLWNFGDGSTGTGIYPWHTFAEPGTYNVCLTVYDINSTTHDTLCSKTTCQTIVVVNMYHCVSSFDYSLNTGYQYHFIANTTSGNQNTYSWNFGDGSDLGSNSNTTHTFSGPGTYNVCLTVYDINSTTHDTLCSDTTCKTIILTDTNLCVAGYNYYHFSGYQYHFYTNATSGNQNTYYWNFGDGTTGSGIYPWHTFSGPGTYNVCLTVYDINSTTHDTLCSDSTCKTVIVADTIHCTASYNYYHFSGYQYHFYTNATTGNQNAYSWNFGDGSALESGIYPWHTFPGNGIYYVCLTAYDINSASHDTLCSAIKCDSIVVDNTGITENNINNLSIIIYPNPVNDNLNIELNTLSGDEYLFDISNVIGQNVKENSNILSKGKNNIIWPISDLPKGIYILTITSADKKLVGIAKFIK